MTFDHEYYVEFCFDEYDTSIQQGLKDVGNAIKSTPYIRPHWGPGTRWTHTAGAAKCVCNYMLSPTCGVRPDAACMDVIFFTDGRANDPHLDICNEISCLHNRRGVYTFAMGVGNHDEIRTECYAEDYTDIGYHVFNFTNITMLEEQFNLVIKRLLTGGFNNLYSCSPSTDTDPST